MITKKIHFKRKHRLCTSYIQQKHFIGCNSKEITIKICRVRRRIFNVQFSDDLKNLTLLLPKNTKHIYNYIPKSVLILV